MTIFSWLKRVFEKPDASSHSPNENVYDTLTPKIITDASVSEYFEALDFAFTQKDVKNIAITGPYGAGKSTVILSYLSARLKKDFINVSLADFSMSRKDNEKPPENAEIELSILQQILYKENKDNLPDSRIDRIQNRNNKHVIWLFLNSLSVLAPSLLLLFSIIPKKILPFFGISENVVSLINNAYPERLFFSMVLVVMTLFFIVRVASKAGLFDKKLKLSKIAFLQGSADMTPQESSSLLNNCLDEIVYFFSRTGHKIVIFEDLDRLGNTEVFVKLREINQIVNNNMQGDPVRFVYACKDDIFLGADIRTKFFDFILPIIPVMDARNAYTHLKNKITDFPEVNKVLLKQTSLYIGDMRTLQNIANEYNLFRRIVDEKKNEAKVFSLIFYKNIYAQDYHLTDRKAGVLYSFVNDYRLKRLHENYFESLDERERNISERIEQIRKESASSATDVRKDIICRYISEPLWSIIFFASKSGNYYAPYTMFEASNLYNNENEFMAFFSGQEQRYAGYSNNQNFYQIDTENVAEEYKKRERLVSADRKIELKKAITELQEVKENIRTRNAITLAELLTRIGENRFKEIAEGYIEKCNDPDIIDKEQLETIRSGFRFGGLEALYYLLTNGFIMQDYMMFRSIFHEGTISVNDNDYIKAVGRQMGCAEINDNYALDNEKDVLSDLIDQNYIYRSGALHHQIIAYMLDSQDLENKNTLSGMVSEVFNKNHENIILVFRVLEAKFNTPDLFVKFIVNSLEKNRYLDKMLAVLEGSGSDTIKTKVAVNMIAFVSPDATNDNERYRRFIEDEGYQLVSHLSHEMLQPFMNNVKKIGVIFDDITLPVTEIENQALKFVADNHMYSFDKENYRAVVAGLLQHVNVTCEQVDDVPLSLVNRYELSNVKAYIDTNIDVFVRDIFIASEEISNTIVSVLKHPSLSDEVRIEILKKMQFTVDDLHLFTEEVDMGEDAISYHDLFYRYDHVVPGWEALIAYVCENCNPDVLTSYIEKHAKVLGEQPLDLVDGDKYDLLYMKVICNEQLNDVSYAAVMKPVAINVHYWDERFSIHNFRRLISGNKIILDSESFDKAAERFIPLTDEADAKVFVSWFVQNKDTFLRNTDYYLKVDEGDAFLETSLTEINSSPAFSEKEKATLLLKYNGKYNDNFLSDLSISREVMLSLIALSDADNFKILLIIRLIKTGYVNRRDITVLIDKLQEKEFSKLFSQKSATLTLSNPTEAESLLSALQNVELIKKWTVREDGKYHVVCRAYFSQDDESE
ncbi:YobI family P-loop NTPase [Serratia quinivorans]|uniref:YobI family P-loop NTPase n=1 Tax=Serratia quinivorans TaxID=137545 RepID=UPI003F9B9CF5